MTGKYLFNKYYNLSNIISLILFIMSIFFLTFKGLNYGVDFKGGTLIELRSDNTNYKTEDIRGAFNKLNLDDLSVKKFGAEGDYVIKFKRSDLNEPDFIKNLKNDLDNYLEDYSFRRVENVGPKVSAELLQDGVTAIAIALAAISISALSFSIILSTVPTIPPEVITLSPRFKPSTMTLCSFTFFCCGLIKKK